MLLRLSNHPHFQTNSLSIYLRNLQVLVHRFLIKTNGRNLIWTVCTQLTLRGWLIYCNRAFSPHILQNILIYDDVQFYYPGEEHMTDQWIIWPFLCYPSTIYKGALYIFYISLLFYSSYNLYCTVVHSFTRTRTVYTLNKMCS